MTPDLSPAEAWLAARDPAERKRRGQWTTPWWLVQATVDAVVGELGPAPVVVDPACGDGRWLVAVARRRPDATLIGVDDDPLAVEAARATLAAAGVRARLVHGDFLAEPCPVPTADLVVGNPPYVRPQNLPRARATALWARFETATDKSDLYCCFVEQALAVAPRVALVLPEAWLHLASFAALRDRVARAGVAGIYRVPARTFPVTVQTVVLVTGSRAGHAGCATPDGLVAERALATSADAWSLEGPLPELDGVPLGELATLAMGVVCGDYDRYVHPGRRWPEDQPICRGRDVHRWVIDDRGEFLRYDPADMLRRKPYVAPKRAALFDVPVKIVLAGTSGRELRAAIDTERRFPLDSCYVIGARDGVDPWALLGVLVSGAAGRWYGARHRAARVKAVEVARLPVPRHGLDGIAAAAREADDVGLDAAVAEAYGRG